ncbi:hypothetical protein [Bradyrhizobium sp. Ce-3]|uniref:hypothetical protein n=1 Tax=Bradyrhizobium sp. Ce-3 TaxID=2913970 RepID=UPI001FC83501|nr:hypothetical protein [Bradyrhizobium sp. Ce-3]GKQ53272.1 hypothetical protein BRSPCE3_41270 [Bradyrhizobium sp. Ce-3]
MITQPSPFPLTERKTLRSWLSGVMRSFDHSGDAADRQHVAPVPPASSPAGSIVGPSAPDLREQARGEVLAFPVHGEALLVKLADVLRRHVAGREPADNPLRLTISRYPWTRLSIDAAAYVDYLSEIETFQAAIEAGPETKVILKTTDFDALASFVMQYVNDRLTSRASMEAAP